MWGISYWILPLISGFMWLGMLIAMLVVWAEGNPPKQRYSSMEPGQTIAYISDIGASGLKPLFITGCVITAIFLDLSLVAERWLRHSGRLAKNRTVLEKVVSWLSILAAIAGTVGLIGLSIADTVRHGKLHVRFLAVFIIGYVVSAIFVCWEYQRLGIHFREHRILRASFWTKLFFIIVEIALAIAFGVTRQKDQNDTAAVLEWLVSFIFTFYIFSFFIDLIPAHSRRTMAGKGTKNDSTRMQMETNDEEAGAWLEQSRSRESFGRGRPETREMYQGDGSRLTGRQGGTHQGTGSNNPYAHPEPEMARNHAHGHGTYDRNIAGAFDNNGSANGGYANGGYTNGGAENGNKPYPPPPAAGRY